MRFVIPIFLGDRLGNKLFTERSTGMNLKMEEKLVFNYCQPPTAYHSYGGGQIIYDLLMYLYF